MSDRVRVITVAPRLVVALLLCFLGLLSLPAGAAAWSAANLSVVSHGAQRFWNYDFEGAHRRPTIRVTGR